MMEAHRRGDAIRVLTDFSLNDIYPLLYEIIKKGLNDTSPYVRLISLNGLLKVRANLFYNWLIDKWEDWVYNHWSSRRDCRTTQTRFERLIPSGNESGTSCRLSTAAIIWVHDFNALSIQKTVWDTVDLRAYFYALHLPHPCSICFSLSHKTCFRWACDFQ